MKFKTVKLGSNLFLAVLILIIAIGLVSPGLNLGSVLAQAAVTVGPMLSIPTNLPAAVNSTVSIPIQFTSNGHDISSITYSVDYDETWLTFDPTEPLSITVNLPPGFVGGCAWDLADVDGELDCYALDPAEPLMALPDQVITSITLQTGNPPLDTIAPVGFSNDPDASYGNTFGESVPGSTQDGSVWFVPPPSAPTNLSGSASCEQVSLSWSDESDNEEGFRIYRKDCVLCSYVNLGTVGANITAFVDNTVQAEQTYYYKSCAFNAAGEACSNVLQITTNPEDACFLDYLPLIWKNYFADNRISGTVRDQVGSPVSDATVSDPDKGAYAITGTDGAYSIEGSVPGTYHLSAAKSGYVCSTNEATIPPSATDVDFICVSDAAGNFISGRILDSENQPVEGVTIADPFRGYHAYSNSGGYYTLASIPSGNYHLVAYKEGYTCTALFANPIGVPPSSAGKNFQCVQTAGCTDLVVNDGFEMRYGWEIPITEYTAGYTTQLAHTGNSSMRTGIVIPQHNRYSWSSARQIVTIPHDATRAMLRFFRFTIGESGPWSIPAYPGISMFPATDMDSLLSSDSYYPNDLHLVLILDVWDNMLGSLIWGLSHRPTWTYQQFDLRAYRGKTVKLYFGTVNNGSGGVSSMFVDDVMLDTCH